MTGAGCAAASEAPRIRQPRMRVVLKRERLSELSQSLLERLHEEILSPNDGLVHPELARQVIHSTLEDALPLLVTLREMFLTQGSQNADRGGPVEMALYRIMHQPTEAQHTGGCYR